MRRFYNLALDLAWLPAPLLPKRAWPTVAPRTKRRGITSEEYEAVIRAEQNEERRKYYQLLWETGAAQTDAALLTAENIDCENRTLVYERKKLQDGAAPCRLRIGAKLEALLRTLPSSGLLFPSIAKADPRHRSAEFCRRCRLLGIKGVSLHSFRYAWAERACAAGYPERYAQAALGHGSKAVHRAYARGAKVLCPPA
jgi:integrase